MHEASLAGFCALVSLPVRAQDNRVKK